MHIEFLHILILEGRVIQCPEKKRKGPTMLESRSRALRTEEKAWKSFKTTPFLFY
jgi:hypothetical protein